MAIVTTPWTATLPNGFLHTGDADDDVFTPTGDADTFTGGGGRDRVSYAASLEAIRADLSDVTYSTRTPGSAGDAEGDQFFGISELEGTAFDDWLYSGAEGATVLGGGGNDRLSGLAGDDVLFGGDGDDEINAFDGGLDRLYGGAGNDAMSLWDDGSYVAFGDEGNDILYSHSTNAVVLYGGAGRDALTGGSADDILYGGDGDDTLEGGEGDDRLFSGYGEDLVSGGRGNDIYIIGEQLPTEGVHPQDIGFFQDSIVETETYANGGGIDTVISYSDHTLGDNFEVLRLRGDAEIGIGNSLSNVLVGNDADNWLQGDWGDDRIIGNAGDDKVAGAEGDDLLSGGAGNDRLFGGAGRDMLSGGAGADIFYFHAAQRTAPGAENRDFINGFEHGADKIALFFDANIFTPILRLAEGGYIGDEDWIWIGQDSFSSRGWTSAGELRTQSLGEHNAVIVEGDINGDGEADFQIFVNGTNGLSMADFLF